MSVLLQAAFFGALNLNCLGSARNSQPGTRNFYYLASMKSNNKLTADQSQKLIATLKSRFEKNMQRHKGISWDKVEAKLKADQGKLRSLQLMEETGGEPDVVGQDKKSGGFIFYDCSAESPAGRRSLCYDDEALASRKEHKPKDSAVAMAESMGVELLNEEEYRSLQELGNFDTKTSSWINTPGNIRKLGGAVFCDRRYNTIFLYHNGAESYYAARGWRGKIIV
jgi:hypothetical protein